MTSILVTGGAGYIGSHTCKALRHAGFDPITYDNLTRGNPESIKWGALEVGELTDQSRLRATLARYRPAAVIHFAALTDVGESNHNPLLYYQNNVGGTAVLLAAMRDCGVNKMIFSSSCAVYGVPAVVPVSEDTPCAPINPYGATKMICERRLAECAVAFPLSFMALRYFNAAGADPEGEIDAPIPPNSANCTSVETIAALKQGSAPKVVICVQMERSHDQLSPRGTRVPGSPPNKTVKLCTKSKASACLAVGSRPNRPTPTCRRGLRLTIACQTAPRGRARNQKPWRDRNGLMVQYHQVASRLHRPNPKCRQAGRFVRRARQIRAWSGGRYQSTPRDLAGQLDRCPPFASRTRHSIPMYR
jgi:NAD dependent epimerase/dehydratase family